MGWLQDIIKNYKLNNDPDTKLLYESGNLIDYLYHELAPRNKPESENEVIIKRLFLDLNKKYNTNLKNKLEFLNICLEFNADNNITRSIFNHHTMQKEIIKLIENNKEEFYKIIFNQKKPLNHIQKIIILDILKIPTNNQSSEEINTLVKKKINEILSYFLQKEKDYILVQLITHLLLQNTNYNREYMLQNSAILKGIQIPKNQDFFKKLFTNINEEKNNNIFHRARFSLIIQLLLNENPSPSEFFNKYEIFVKCNNEKPFTSYKESSEIQELRKSIKNEKYTNLSSLILPLLALNYFSITKKNPFDTNYSSIFTFVASCSLGIFFGSLLSINNNKERLLKKFIK